MTDFSDEAMDELDQAVLEQLAGIFDVIDPPPAGLADEAILQISLAGLDAELAALQDASALSLRTSEARPTDTVTFTSSALQLMVSAAPEEDGRLRIDGWVTGGGIEVELLSSSSSHAATSDAHGRLLWRSISPGPMRFLLHPANADARPVLTPVIEL